MTTSSETVPELELRRVILGFALAPTVGALLFSLSFTPFLTYPPPRELDDLITRIGYIFLVGWVLAFACTILLGVPIYIFLRKRVRATLPTAVLMGGFLALVLGILFPLNFSKGIFQGWDRISAGMIAYRFLHFALFFASGLVGGLTFWLCAFRRNPRLTTPASP